MLVLLEVLLVEHGCECTEEAGLGHNHGLGHLAEEVGEDRAEVEGTEHCRYLALGHGVVHLNVSGPLLAGLYKAAEYLVEGECVANVLFLVLCAKVGLGHNHLCYVCPDAENLLLLGCHLGLVVGRVGEDNACTLEVYEALLGVLHIGLNADVEGGGDALERQGLVEAAEVAELLYLAEHGEVLECGGDAVLRLLVRILCYSIELASSLEVVVGVGLGLCHFLKLAHHDLLDALCELGEAACGGLIVRNNELFECFAVDEMIEVVLNSDVFHNYLLLVFSRIQ